MMKQSFFFLLVLCVGFSCQQQAMVSPLDKVVISAEVSKMLNAYHQDIEIGGLTTEFKYLDTSSSFFWVPPGYSTALSYDSVHSILEGNAPLFQSIEFHWDVLQVFPLSSELANFTGIVKGKMVDTSGTETAVSIIESGTVIKRHDGWKLLSGQSANLTE